MTHPGFYAYIPDEKGQEPTGTENRKIIHLKSLQAVIKQINQMPKWKNSPYKVFTFTNFYDKNSFKLIYENKPIIESKIKSMTQKDKLKTFILKKKLEEATGKKVVLQE